MRPAIAHFPRCARENGVKVLFGETPKPARETRALPSITLDTRKQRGGFPDDMAIGQLPPLCFA